jgi:aminopeptidase
VSQTALFISFTSTTMNVDHCTKNILLDEKIGGTIHLALGASYPETGGVNQSSLHWEMVCDLWTGGEVRVDGEPFCRVGKFLVSFKVHPA